MTEQPRLSVLIVNDEPLVGRVFSRILRMHGHDARVALGGREALALLRQEPGDLVVTDGMMPGMNGIELLRAVKHEFPDLPAFLTTGSDGPGWTEELAKLGFPPAVELPVSGDDFIGYVERSTFR